MDFTGDFIYLGLAFGGFCVGIAIGFYVGFRSGQISVEPTVVRRAKRRLKDLEDKDALEAEIIEEQKL